MKSQTKHSVFEREILLPEHLPEFPDDQIITIHNEDPNWRPNTEVKRSRNLVYTDEIRSQIADAMNRLLKFVGKYHQGRDMFAWQLAIDEVFPNALKHGHRANPNLVCRIAYTHDNGSTVMYIQDSGPGFDVSKQLQVDCTDEDHIREDNGRGLTLMRTFMDEVRWNIEGNGVALWKRPSCPTDD